MKFAASRTAKRASVAVALSAALLTGTTGCTFINTYKGDQPTTLMYDASDGVSYTMWVKGQRFDIRNLMVISEGNGQPGRLLGTVLNLGNEDVDFTLDLGIDGVENPTIHVPVGEEVRFEDDANQLIIPEIPVQPGEILQTTGVIGDTTEASSLPVLDGTLEEYQPYLPNAAEADSANPTPSVSARPLTDEELAQATATPSADANN
ncbi:hypothetical protein [Rothia aerolata]|uniref:DNA modification methylase n=1 Tax=Rothia aerolata TaxID=1812262 RepID=A0A917MV05_9MICC|nr:hypothetical protein [Rothia aerolata]GGH65461.1 hypothetical protein GCM10007359_18730 [Rothia aerolata]